MNQLELSPAEHDVLAQDQAFVAALRQLDRRERPFLAGTRRKLLFDVGASRATCHASAFPPA